MVKKNRSGFSTIELLIILVVVGLLVVFVAGKFNSIRQNSRDEQRKADINSLQLAVQSYWAQTGNYPSVAQLNSSVFRNTNLKSLTQGNFQDPKWSAKNKLCT